MRARAVRPRRGGALLIVPVLGLTLGACASGSPSASNASTTTTTTSAAQSATLPDTNISAFAACQSDFQSVTTAVTAYQAESGAFPTPPAPWSASGYQQDYTPLTASSKGGPFMKAAPPTTHYVIEYDASGHVWAEPAGQYDAVYNPARAAPVGACAIAVTRP
jgi:hypothetical protein